MSTRRRAVATGLCALAVVGCTAQQRYQCALTPALGPDASPLLVTISEVHAIAVDRERVRLTRDYFALHHPALAAALPAGDGPEAIAFVPRLVVVHYTAYPTLERSLAVFAPATIDSGRELVARNGALNVGVQFLVDRDGSIHRLYPETAMARHTIGLNHVGIGIENVGDGDLGAADAVAPLTAAQVAANVALIADLLRRHPTIGLVIGHAEYRDLEDPRHPGHALFVEAVPGYRTEKVDPGRRFMRGLRRGLRRLAAEG